MRSLFYILQRAFYGHIGGLNQGLKEKRQYIHNGKAEIKEERESEKLEDNSLLKLSNYFGSR